MSFWHIGMCVGHFNKIFVDIASKVGKRIEPNLSGKHITVYPHGWCVQFSWRQLLSKFDMMYSPSQRKIKALQNLQRRIFFMFCIMYGLSRSLSGGHGYINMTWALNQNWNAILKGWRTLYLSPAKMTKPCNLSKKIQLVAIAIDIVLVFF